MKKPFHFYQNMKTPKKEENQNQINKESGSNIFLNQLI